MKKINLTLAEYLNHLKLMRSKSTIKVIEMKTGKEVNTENNLDRMVKYVETIWHTNHIYIK